MDNKDSRLKTLNHYYDIEDWKGARRIIQELLKSEPDSHWLLTNLGMTYYEEFQYVRAIKYIEKALSLAPKCPLVLWDYAGALDMLGKEDEAIKIWKRLIKRGIENIAYGECGEGIRWAKSLINDCRYRIGNTYLRQKRHKIGLKYLCEHVNNRQRGIFSVYSRKAVLRQIKNFELLYNKR